MSFIFSKQVDQLKQTIAQLEQANSEHETVLTTLKQEHETKIASLEQAHATKLAQQAQSHETAIATLKQEHQNGFEEAVQKATVAHLTKMGAPPLTQSSTSSGGGAERPACTLAQYQQMTDKERDEFRDRGGIVGN